MKKVKQKTHRGAAKRFKVVAKRKKIKHRRSNRAHIKTKQDHKRVLHSRSTGYVSKADSESVQRMLCNK